MTNIQAIDLLKDLEQSLDDYCELNDEGKTAFQMAITALELFGNSEQLSSVQLELAKNSPILDNENGELISRQDAIDAVYKCTDIFVGNMPVMVDKADAYEALAQLPSAQPEQQSFSRCQENDAISRKAAIDALSNMMDTDGFRDGWAVSRANVDCMLRSLPSAKSEVRTQMSSADCIRRQAAIDALKDRYYKYDRFAKLEELVWAINTVPSVQPEIIRCKECTYGEQDDDGRWYCRSLGCQIGNDDGSGFCADAERREGEG